MKDVSLKEADLQEKNFGEDSAIHIEDINNLPVHRPPLKNLYFI